MEFMNWGYNEWGVRNPNNFNQPFRHLQKGQRKNHMDLVLYMKKESRSFELVSFIFGIINLSGTPFDAWPVKNEPKS